MTLQQIKYIITVADEASISKASNKLYVSQPRISNAIHEMEDELGFEIFERSSRGVTVTPEGHEFLRYARQILCQSDILEERFFSKKEEKLYFSVSSHHYLFSTCAFIEFIKRYSDSEYDFALNETSTYNIIMDVKERRSELGILFLDNDNEKMIKKLLRENELVFEELLVSKMYVYMADTHPLAAKEQISLEELQEYPCIVMDQGKRNEFFFSEQALPMLRHKRTIKVSDIATAIKLEIELNAYMLGLDVSTDILSNDPIIARPLASVDIMVLGMIKREREELSDLGKEYMELLRNMLKKTNRK